MRDLAERVAELEDTVGRNDVQAAKHFREQFGLLSGAIHRLDGKVTALDGRLTVLEGKVTALDAKVTALDGKVRAIDRRLDRFERDVKAAFVAVDVRLDSMSADLKTLLRRTAPVRKRARSKKKR
jgi:outer membrane murein-binding lipoprotein Lpp